jgi:carbonic anhydrase/acetyltransferase-like protein (isoleucine patch superfamily)
MDKAARGSIMSRVQQLIDRIVDRVNINLREPAFDVGPYVREIIPVDQFVKFYAFYGLTPHHPLHFSFAHSSLAGSYFLGRCTVEHAVLYKSDIRGDELKRKGTLFEHKGIRIPLHEDEEIRIRDSFLIKTLVHNNSHDPESPEEFHIRNTVAMHYANIHGAPVEGCFIGPFATVDLTTVHDCVIGAFSYVQTGELNHREVSAGTIWIRADGAFEFRYNYADEALARYVSVQPGQVPTGILMDFVETRKGEFQEVFESVGCCRGLEIPEGASVSPYSVVKGESTIGRNVLVAQRAYLNGAHLGPGANAQENCYIVDSILEGFNVTAHGGKIIGAHLGEKVFVGFNSFVRGTDRAPLKVGAGSIVMPHTLIDLEEPLEIPEGRIVWGLVRNAADLEENSVSAEELSRVDGEFSRGRMVFRGKGEAFVQAFRHRIQHILEENGAYYDGTTGMGHAQKGQNMVFNIIQPYPDGDLKGMVPTIDIRP